MDPAPERRQGMTWKEFLRAHWEVLAATDFFTVELWTGRGLVRYHVLFLIKLMTREVRLAGLVPEPNEAWMLQVGRHLTDPWVGYLRSSRCLLHDRATLFSERFRQLLRSAGGAASPAGAFAQLERVCGTVRAHDPPRVSGPDDFFWRGVAAKGG